MNEFILGFKQKKLIESNLSIDDAVILRALSDIVKTSMHKPHQGFTWVRLDYLMDLIPIVGKKRFIQMRIAHFVKLGLIKKRVIHYYNGQKGTYHMIKLLPLLETLTDQVKINELDQKQKIQMTEYECKKVSK